MIPESAHALTAAPGSLIGDNGFTALLRDEDQSASYAGILGTPQVDPTREGLSIEDSYGAALDSIILSLLENFARQEAFSELLDPGCNAGCVAA